MSRVVTQLEEQRQDTRDSNGKASPVKPGSRVRRFATQWSYIYFVISLVNLEENMGGMGISLTK